jgi:DNA-binding response OmpR family regulator
MIDADCSCSRTASKISTFQVDVAQTRADVLEKVGEARYDLILVDLEMPNEWMIRRSLQDLI